MKVIDLLDKIANGEEVPKKIKYGSTKFHFDKDIKMYDSDLMHGDLLSYIDGLDLNDEIEIIEDQKKFEDIEELTWCTAEIQEKDIQDTINQLIRNQKKIIDYINKGDSND